MEQPESVGRRILKCQTSKCNSNNENEQKFMFKGSKHKRLLWKRKLKHFECEAFQKARGTALQSRRNFNAHRQKQAEYALVFARLIWIYQASPGYHFWVSNHIWHRKKVLEPIKAINKWALISSNRNLSTRRRQLDLSDTLIKKDLEASNVTWAPPLSSRISL